MTRHGMRPGVVRDLFSYDPDTGLLSWRHTGKIAGSVDARTGRRRIKVAGRLWLSYILVWAWLYRQWPQANKQIDHIDGNKLNDRQDNLREATRAQNARNVGRTRANKSGYKGVDWFAPQQKWRARIKADTMSKFLGYFDSPEEAHEAYKKAAAVLHGEFANTGGELERP